MSTLNIWFYLSSCKTCPFLMTLGWSWTAHVTTPAPGGHQACRPGCELPADRALGWFLEASNPSSCQLPLNEFHQRLRSCGLRSDWVRLGSGPKCRQSAGGWPLSTCSYELGRRWRLTQGPRRSPCREGPLERPLLRGFPPCSYPDPQTT